MYDIKDVLAAAEAIFPILNDLLGPEAEKIKKELSELLTKAKDGEDVELELMEMLTENDKTREWIRNRLENKRLPDQEKSYSKLPGESEEAVPGIQEYVCPNCNYTFIRQWVGQKVPKCPTHHTNLELYQGDFG